MAGLLDKQKWLDIAQIINEFRIVPRLLLMFFGGFLIWYSQHATYWYMALPAAERSTSDAAFVSGTIGAFGTLMTIYANIYTNSPKYRGPPE